VRQASILPRATAVHTGDERALIHVEKREDDCWSLLDD
jgi:hypothetical protein